MENEGFVSLVAQSIVENDIDVGIDLFEVGLDSILDIPVLEPVPLVKTICAIAKTGFAIREKHMLKKTIIFLQQLNSNGVDSDEYEEYKQKLREKDKILYRELENTLIYVDRVVDEYKSKILANLFYNYICKKILWEQFLELSDIVDNLFLQDLKELRNIYKKREIVEDEVINVIALRRLITLNLVFKVEMFSRRSNGNYSMTPKKVDYIISSLGDSLIEFGFNSSK